MTRVTAPATATPQMTTTAKTLTLASVDHRVVVDHAAHQDLAVIVA
jgi:hypothetical protein